MKVGKWTYGHDKIEIKLHGAEIEIGNFCSIADGVKAYLGSNHRIDWITTYPFGHIHNNTFNHFKGEGHPSTKGDIIIGNDVWIGMDAILMSGIKIGDGAVIGANTVVAKDVAPYSIFVGNPGNSKRKRFSDDDIDFLLKLQWWNMDDTIINDIAPMLCSDNIEALKEWYTTNIN
jgi:acetyltransferase-like isoleucine patch superfamily enzyme